MKQASIASSASSLPLRFMWRRFGRAWVILMIASLEGSVSFSPEFARKFWMDVRNEGGAVAIVSA